MADKPAAYEQARSRVTSILRDRGPQAGDLRVPACPDWTVKDLVAHLQHVAEDYSAGRYVYPSLDFDQPRDHLDTDRVARNEAWADAGVAARREQTLEELLQAWETSAQRLYRMMTDEPAVPDPRGNDMLAWAALGDFAIHYQDLHGALGLPADRVAYCAKLGVATLPAMFAAHVETVGDLHPLRFETARGDVVIAADVDDSAAPTLQVDWFELYRAMSGRRSREQVVALLQPLDPEPYIGAFTLYPFASQPLAV